jgi:hypothetical protein
VALRCPSYDASHRIATDRSIVSNQTADWVECWLRPGTEPKDIYDWLGRAEGAPDHVHHFWNEPWWPGGWVVRVRGSNADLNRHPGVVEVIQWDDEPDERLYGEQWWDWVQGFFEASSVIAARKEDRLNTKLIHCYLNARGLSVWQEAKWALGFFWNRVTINWRLRWRYWMGR